MKSQALQELIKKVFSDDEAKRQFMSDPDSFISQFALTDQEKRAVLNTHDKLGLVAADSQQLEAALEPTQIWLNPVP
jgi:hypothetical protein